MEQLAGEIGIGRTTLHRYFPSRDEMLAALSRQAVVSAIAALERANLQQGSARQAVSRLVEEFFPIAELYTFIANGSADNTEAMQAWLPYHQQLIEQVRQWQTGGEMRLDLSAAWILESMSQLLRGAGAMVREGRLARNEAIGSIVAVLLDGIGKA